MFMIEKGVNIFNFLLIFNFVNWVIGVVVFMYVVFKSMIFDIGKMFQGDDIKKEMFVFGVMFVCIYKVMGFSK